MGFWDFVEDCCDWVCDNVENIAMTVVAATVMAVGVCVTAAAVPFLSPVAGLTLMGAGVSGLMCAFSKKTTWKEFATKMVEGAVIGAVSGLFSWGASTLIAKAGLTGISSLLLNCSVRIIAGVGSSFVTNGLNNIFNRKDFTDNWDSALKSGLIIGVIGAVAEGFQYFNAKTEAEQANNLLSKTMQMVSGLKKQCCDVVDSYAGNAKWVVYNALEMVKVLTEGAAMQLLTTGKVDVKMLLIGAAIYGTTRIARAAYDYRQKQKNDNFIKKPFDDHGKKDDQIRRLKADKDAKETEMCKAISGEINLTSGQIVTLGEEMRDIATKIENLECSSPQLPFDPKVDTVAASQSASRGTGISVVGHQTIAAFQLASRGTGISDVGHQTVGTSQSASSGTVTHVAQPGQPQSSSQRTSRTQTTTNDPPKFIPPKDLYIIDYKVTSTSKEDNKMKIQQVGQNKSQGPIRKGNLLNICKQNHPRQNQNQGQPQKQKQLTEQMANNWGYEPVELPRQFSYTSVGFLNNPYDGLLHALLGHAAEFARGQELPPGIQGVNYGRLQELISHLTTNRQAAYRNVQIALNDDSQLRAELVKIQIEFARLLEQLMAKCRYLGVGHDAVNDAHILYFDLGNDVLAVVLTNQKWDPLPPPHDPRPVRFLLTAFRMKREYYEKVAPETSYDPPNAKNTQIQTCTAKLEDPKGNVTTGRNARQRRHDGEMKEMRNEERSAYDQEHLPNPHRDDLVDQFQRLQVSGEQTYIDVRRQKSDDEEKASTSRVSYKGKPRVDNQDYPPEVEDPSSDEEDCSHDTVCKVTGMKKLFAKSDDILATLEEELYWQSKLKMTYAKKKEEEEKLKNDDFIRNNIIKQENVYVKSSSRGQEIRAGTSKEPMAGEAYPAGQLFSKKMKKEDEKDESKKSFWKIKKGQNKSKAATSAEQRIVETFPIVAWSEKHNKYMMVDHNSWPKPIEGMTKMIAFLGVHKSGRTTLLHSLIYKAGYKMTKEQSLLTKVGLGINMYVLRELGLIFLDICDSIDMIGDLQKDTTPLGNVILETFGYVNCDNLVYSLPFGENDDGLHQTKADDGKMTTQDAIDYINSRVKLLFAFSNQMLNFAGAMRITVVPRWEYIEGATCDKWRELEKHFEEMHTRIELVKIVDKREDGTPLNDEERFGHLTEEDVLLGAKHHTVILPVRFFQPGRSINDDGFYRSELERLWKSVEEDTGAHLSSLGIEEMAETSVYGSMITTWNRLVENKEITTCLAEVSNEKTLKKARGEDGAQSAIEIYCNRLQDYLKEIPPNCSLAHAMEKYAEERKEKSKEYESALEDERDPETFFRLLLKSGTILIRECLQMTDGNLKEKGLGIGLSVFSTLLGQGDKTMDIRLLRLGIVDLDLIKLLNNPLIYMHYHEAWVIFYFMADRGFRFHLLEVPLWDALREILTRNDELIPVKMKIYDWALHTLMSMMNLDEMPLLPPEGNVGRLNDKKVYLSSNQRIQLDYDYRLYSEEHVERLFADTVNYNKEKRDGIASDNYDKLIAMAEEFYKSHEICKETSLLFEDLHVSCRDQFASVTLNHFHKQCAIYFAQGLFDKKVVKVLKQKGKEGRVEKIVLILKVLRTAVAVMTRDKKLAPLLVDSGLHDWLRTEFLTDEKVSFSVYCHAAAIASHIMFVQSSLGIGKLPKEVSNTKVNTLGDVAAREKRERQVKFYGAYRLQLLEANCHELAVCKLHGFFDGGLPAGDMSSATSLLNFIIILITNTIDEEERKRFADFFIIRERKKLINQMKKLVDLCADKVNFKQIDATKSQLSAIESAMELVNRLIWSYYANHFEKFFGSGNSELLDSMTSIMRQVFEKVVVPSLTAKERLSNNVDKSLQSLRLEFVCLSLNVSTISGISFTDVKYKLGQDKVGTLGSLMEKNPRQKNDNPEILLKMDDLTKLKPNEPGYDSSNVQRAAYIINNSDRNIYSQFKGLVQTMVKTAQNLKTEEEEAKRLLESATTKRKRLEALEKRTVASDGPSYADRMKSEDEPSTSSAPKKITLACDGVFLKTTLLDNFSLPRKDFENLLFEKLVEVYDLAIAYVYMLLLMNNSPKGTQNLDRLLQHLKNLLDSHEDQMIKSDEPFLSLRWMSRVLHYLGYWHDEGSSAKTWFAPSDIKSNERDIVYNTMKKYLPLQRDVALKLDTTFKEVKEVTETSYQSQTLPEEFFSSLDTDIQKSLKEKTVVELIKNKSQLKEINYILVRVEVSSGDSKRVYQAVFNKCMSVSSVLQSLQDKKIVESILKLTLTSPPLLDLSRSLDNIGEIAIYLYGN